MRACRYEWETESVFAYGSAFNVRSNGDRVGLRRHGVHRAARISSAGHGDQILLSQTTRDLLEGRIRFACFDLGAHPLKDLEQTQRLYQLVDLHCPELSPLARWCAS